MSDLTSLTAAEFAALKHELPESGRWHELHDGQTVLLSAPDDVHGTIVLNLSRALGEWFGTQPVQSRGKLSNSHAPVDRRRRFSRAAEQHD